MGLRTRNRTWVTWVITANLYMTKEILTKWCPKMNHMKGIELILQVNQRTLRSNLQSCFLLPLHNWLKVKPHKNCNTKIKVVEWRRSRARVTTQNTIQNINHWEEMLVLQTIAIIKCRKCKNWGRNMAIHRKPKAPNNNQVCNQIAKIATCSSKTTNWSN